MEGATSLMPPSISCVVDVATAGARLAQLVKCTSFCGTMGELIQYHITMLITSEQEDSIRTLFRDKNWPCWLKVLSDENVGLVIQNGFTDIFPVMVHGQDGGIGQTVFTEIKSEIIDLDLTNDSESFEQSDTSPRKVEPPTLSDNEDTMDYDMMSNNSVEESDVKMEKAAMVENNEESEKQTEMKGTTAKREASKIPCPMCKMPCANKKTLRRHYTRIHKGTLPEYQCSICKKWLDKKEDLWEHRLAEHESNEEAIKSADMGQRSLNKLQKLGNLRCEFCGNFYPHSRSLRRHKYKVHKEVMPKWTCPICGEEYETRDELWKHKRERGHKSSIWTLGNYQCDSCGKIYNRYDSFTEHKLSCQKTDAEKAAIRQYPCDICGLVFKSVLRVKSHKRGVHIVSPVICDECGTICKNKRALLVHRRRHDTKNRKYVCDDCGKGFFNTTLLSQHVRTHTKEKPFKCPLCDYTCAIKQNIHKHSQKVHKVLCKAVRIEDSKERVIPQGDDLMHSGQDFGMENIPSTKAEILQELQSQSIELISQLSRNSFKSETNDTSTPSGEQINYILD